MKGRILSHEIVQIFTEFQDFFAVFANSTYDSLHYQDTVSIMNYIFIITMNINLFEPFLALFQVTYILWLRKSLIIS